MPFLTPLLGEGSLWTKRKKLAAGEQRQVAITSSMVLAISTVACCIEDRGRFRALRGRFRGFERVSTGFNGSGSLAVVVKTVLGSHFGR